MLSHDKIGSGIPLVFIHAFPLSRQMWKYNAPALSRNFQFIVADMPGFGGSPLEREESSMEYMADQLADTLKTIGISQKIILTGVSMGGYVCFQFFRKYSALLRGLLLVSTRATPDTEQARAKRLENIQLVRDKGISPLVEIMLGQFFGETAKKAGLQCIPEARQWMEMARPEGVIAALKGMASRPDSTPLLSGINIPALVLAGQEDKLAPQAEMEGMARQIPQSEFQVVPQAGHLLPLEKPREFNDLVLKFLKRKIL